MRTFLGVDQSLSGTGLVVLSDAGDILLQRLVQPASLRGVERLAAIRGAIREALDAFKPVSAALEGYSYGSTGRVFQLGELGGLVQMAFWDAGVPFHTVTPAALKKFVANKHQATKEQMLEATRTKWKIDFGNEDDLCDAYGLARILKAIACQDSMVRHELEVIVELTQPVPVKTPGAKASRGKIKVSI